MPGLIRPPFGAPTGPLLPDESLFESFVAGARTGHSSKYHIEESTLLVDRLTPVSVRLDTGCLLIRTDVPSPAIDGGAQRIHLTLALVDPPLATVVGLQLLGLPAASWNLWCADHVDAVEALHRAVMDGPVVGGTDPL